MRFLIIISVAVVLSFSANGQTCTCESNFEWVKKTFEKNDAGFQYIINKKGEAAYNIHNQLILERLKAVTTSSECTELLYDWLKFFRSGHIGIERLINETPEPKNIPQTKNEGIAYETWKGDIPQFEKYINEKKVSDYEGVWETGAYKIGIIKDGTNYVGFIMESDVDSWRKPGLVKLKIEQEGDKLKTTFFMRDHSPVICGEPEWMGDNYLKTGTVILKRLKPLFQEDPFVENYFKSTNFQVPYLEILNTSTLYLRIPSFDLKYKNNIDSVIQANRDHILKNENLIIDLRDNGGGGDSSFEKLLPLLYTNPVRTVNMELLSTTQNNQQILDYLTNPVEYELDKESLEWIKEVYDKMQRRLGDFVNINDEYISITQQDTVYPYPKNVGIIINKGNASTTEQFLLAAKQSKKVKLFGETTWGALDISNMNSIESPCKEFKLWYCLSRSLRIPGMTIDDVGIQPDYYLDRTIPPYKWVEYVNNILNQ